MKNISFLYFIFLITLATCCTWQHAQTCVTDYYGDEISIESKISKLNTKVYTDNDDILIYGKVSGKYRSNKKEIIDSLYSATIRLLNIENKEISGVVTDIDGKYHLKIFPGKYDIKVSSLGFASLEVKNLEVKKGEIKEIEFILGARGRNFILSTVDLDTFESIKK